MKNREKYFIKMNTYDLLVKMQKYQREHGLGRAPCVLDMITGHVKPCICDDCNKCIADWLEDITNG